MPSPTQTVPDSLSGQRTEKVALLHDWLTGYRGGERVLEAFCELFPAAPIYTLIHKTGSTSPLLESKTIHTSFLNGWPGIDVHYRKFLPVFPLAARSLNMKSDIEVVLSSHHCVIKGVKTPAGAVHVSYVHSPMRYMYDQYENYFGKRASWPVRAGGRVFRGYLTSWDRASNTGVDLMIANSAFVRERIRKFYERDAEVVHPFVELEDFADVQARPPAKDDFYVMVTAFAPNKRVDLAIEAFNRMKKPLEIIGGGQMDGELRAMAGPTIKFLGGVDRATVIDRLSCARALIFPGVEDFGITPLEALASRTPVIAFRAGGVLETLTDEDTVFFDEATPERLMRAIETFEREGRTPNVDRLSRFSRGRFLREMSAMIELARSRRAR